MDRHTAKVAAHGNVFYAWSGSAGHRGDSDKFDMDQNELAPSDGVPDIRPPSMATFWAILEEQDIRFTRAIHAHECPLHDNGPLWVLQREQLTRELASNVVKGEAKIKLIKQGDVLDRKVQSYKRHLEQYRQQRQFLKHLQGSLKQYIYHHITAKEAKSPTWCLL